MADIFNRIVNMPSARFWVSGTRAAVVIANILKGDELRNMRPGKREMFMEIYRRFLEVRKNKPTWPITKIAENIVTQPAPKFYLAPGSARVIILKARKKWYERNMKRLRR